MYANYRVKDWWRFRLVACGGYHLMGMTVEWSWCLGVKCFGRWFVVARDKTLGQKATTDFFTRTEVELDAANAAIIAHHVASQSYVN
jgi:hypothetical protein